jgi:hypothetical protein
MSPASIYDDNSVKAVQVRELFGLQEVNYGFLNIKDFYNLTLKKLIL